MSEFDTNYSYICCPFCEERISNNDTGDHLVIDLEDDEYDFFLCKSCNNFFKVELSIYKERIYEVTKPTEKEIEDNDLTLRIDPKVEDVPGQQIMWKNLFRDEC